jgi:hypothetical protein
MTAAFVQAAKNSANTVNFLNLTFASMPTNGNTILMGVNYAGGGPSTSVVQTGVTWVLDDSSTSSFAWNFELWRGTVGPGAGMSLTINGTVGCNPCAIAEEWSGLTASPLDQHAMNSSGPSATATASTATTGTTTQANELWWGFIEAFASVAGTGAQSNPTNGFTINTQEPDDAVSDQAQMATVFKIVTSTGTAQTTTDISGTGPFYTTSAIATYEETATSTTSPQRMSMGVGT